MLAGWIEQGPSKAPSPAMLSAFTARRPRRRESPSVQLTADMPAMVQHAPVISLNQFKEVRVDIKPERCDTVVHFRTPSSSLIGRSSQPKRSISRSLPPFGSEDEFARWNVAKESSINFGRSFCRPQSFLWRILDHGRALQIQTVDLSKSGRGKEALDTAGQDDDQDIGSEQRRRSRDLTDDGKYVLHFHFQGPLLDGGIAFADTDNQDILNLFVLSAANELYTFALRRSFFYSASASEVDIERWCQIYRPASSNFATPHTFLARSTLDLIMGLNDGRIVRLTRKAGENGSIWHEVAYNDGKWGSSLRSLVRWQGSNTIPFNGATLEKNTAQAMMPSPDQKHLWVVCLDHSLKVWNLDQGRTVYVNDLIGAAREPHETHKYLLDPHNPNLLQIFGAEWATQGDLYYVMTYSPHDLGQFKVWGIRDADAADRGIRDLYPDDVLRPPDPDPSPESKAIWKMIDFKAKVAKDGFLKVWVLMRSNRQHKLYHLNVPIEDVGRSLTSSWKQSWASTTTELLQLDPPPSISNEDPGGVMELMPTSCSDLECIPTE